MATQIREPEVSIALVSSDTLVGNKPQRVLCIGQKTPAGTAVAGELITQIQNDNSWNGLFGENSMLAGIVRNTRRYNSVSRVDAIALDDNGGGAKAAGNFSFGGTTAGAASSITVAVGSEADHEFEVAVAEGDTPAAIATKVAAAITADTGVPVTATVNTNTVEIEAINAGTVGNSIGLKITGLLENITSAVTAMTGGAVDPSFTGLFDVIEDERYQTIVWAYTNDIDTVKDELDSRFNVANGILDGVAVMCTQDTFANTSALLQANNSNSVVVLCDGVVDQDNYKGGAIMELPYAIAAQISGIRALRLTEDAAIGQFVISRDGALDRFGGIALASLPYFNTPVPQLPLIETGNGFSKQEAETLKEQGGAVVGNNISNNEVLLGETPTTYKTDVAGNEDVTFKFLNYVDTASVCREFYFNNLKARFAQTRLTDGALIAGRAMANGATIEAFCSQLYRELANEALTQAGEDKEVFYEENLLVTLDLSEGKATVQMKLPIVVQLRKLIVTIQVAFTTEG